MANVRGEDFKTPEVIFAFTQGMFEMQESESGRKQWTITLLIPKSASLKPYETAALAVSKTKWEGKAEQFIKDKLIKLPVLDGDGPQGLNKKSGERHKGYAGHWFIRLSSGEDYRPKLVNRKVLPILDKSDFPSGSRGFAVINAYAWENDKGGKGVSFGLSSIQVSRVATGEEVLGGGGGADPSAFFEALPDEGNMSEASDGASSMFG